MMLKFAKNDQYTWSYKLLKRVATFNLAHPVVYSAYFVPLSSSHHRRRRDKTAKKLNKFSFEI